MNLHSSFPSSSSMPSSSSSSSSSSIVNQSNFSLRTSSYAEFVYMNKDFTIFEISLKYSLFTLTFLILFCPYFGYYFKMEKLNPSYRSFEQKWVFTLLILLLLFDEPFVAAKVVI
jgi:hypothetical protein